MVTNSWLEEWTQIVKCKEVKDCFIISVCKSMILLQAKIVDLIIGN